MNPPEDYIEVHAPQKNPDAIAWGTNHEIRWLRHIGRDAGIHIQDNQLTLLKKYQQTMKKRTNWGIMDSTVIRKAVADMIRDARLKL